mgnify:CR=1 FL=1
MSLESLLARLRAGTPSQTDVTDVTPVQPYSRAARSCNVRDSAGVTAVTAHPSAPAHVTPVTAGDSAPLQRTPYGQAACTAVTAVTAQNEGGAGRASAAHWLADVARHLDATPGALLAAGVILPEEVADYRGTDPRAMADALRRVHPGRFTAREPDDRRHCAACINLAGTRCRARRLLVMDDLARRCADYVPTPDDADQRPGCDRWPHLVRPSEVTTWHAA